MDDNRFCSNCKGKHICALLLSIRKVSDDIACSSLLAVVAGFCKYYEED